MDKVFVSGNRSLFYTLFQTLTYVFISVIAFGQTPVVIDAGPERVVVCAGQSTNIGTCDYGSTDIFWVAYPEDSNLNPYEHVQSVSPTTTTTYGLLSGAGNCNPCVDYIEVIVINDITLAVENNTDGSTVTECLGGRMLTFTASAGIVLPPASDYDPEIIFTFSYNNANGAPVEIPVAASSGAIMAEATITPDPVLPGDPDHSYFMPVLVTVSVDGYQCSASEFLNINIYKLWMNYVRDADTDKNWKIRVKKDVEVSAIGPSSCTSWEWSMPDMDQQTSSTVWNPTGGNAKTGIMNIPVTDMPDHNTHFGDTYGTIKVTCTDGEGMTKGFLSTNISPTTKVEVYYIGTAKDSPDQASDPVPPNWFYYYRDEESAGMGAPYTYGSCPTSSGVPRSCSIPTMGDAAIKIHDEAYENAEGNKYITYSTSGFPCSLKALGWSNINKYYRNFISVLEHEREHGNNQVFKCINNNPQNCSPALGDEGDGDGVVLAVETPNCSDPDIWNSAILGNPQFPQNDHYWADNEIIPGGPIEKLAYDGAVSDNDWAAPGYNWNN